MSINPIARTLAALGFHAQPRAGADGALRAIFADVEGEPAAAPPPSRIPPHQRHLYVLPDDALRGYSMGSYRPAATQVGEVVPAAKPAKRTAKSHKRGRASPRHA